MSEKKPIIKIAFAKPKESYFKLPAEERRRLGDELLEKYKELGIKHLVPYINCSWSSEEWGICSVEEYPDIEAVQKLDEWLKETKYHIQLDSRTYLGTRFEAEEWMKYMYT